MNEDQTDCCPRCRSPLEIAFVKFGFGGPTIIACCPNCAMASAEVWRAGKSKTLDSADELARITRGFWQGVAIRMDSLDRQLRYVLAFLIGAVITAAALRHGVHVYGGIPPEENFWDSLIGLSAFLLPIVFFPTKRRR